MIETGEWVGPSEAARVLGVSSQRVRQLADSGELVSIRTGLGRHIAVADVRRLVATRQLLARSRSVPPEGNVHVELVSADQTDGAA